MMFHSKRVTALAALVLSAAMTLTACGSDDDSGGGGGGGGDKTTVTFLPKNLGNPYFDVTARGGEDAVKDFGGTFDQVGPQEASPDAQVQYINTAAQQGVNALVVSANDPTAICDALDQASEAGTKIVTFDSDTDPECRDLYISQATSEGIAKAQVDLISEQIGDKGEIAILSATANATNQNAWIKMMEEDLKANHPDIKLVDTVYGDDDDQTSFDKTAGAAEVPPEPQGDRLADHRRHRSGSSLPVGLEVQGQGQADRARLPQRPARVRQERHHRRLRALGRRGPRLPRGVHRQGPGRR